MKLIDGDWILAMNTAERDVVLDALEVAATFYEHNVPALDDVFSEFDGSNVREAFKDLAQLRRYLDAA